MKKHLLTFVILLFCFSTAYNQSNQKARKTPGTYHTHEEIIDMYRKLCEQHPKISGFESIGKTYQNNDIMAFRYGNPKGGKVILDGCLHGWEDLGSEITYIWIKWLLESREKVAEKILNENCWIVIPVINFDTYDRGNTNFSVCSGGVDLNRNFIHGWKFVPQCTGDYGTSHGESAGSEKETQVMRKFMQDNKPSDSQKAAFINTHYGGGPWIHYDGKDLDTYYNPLREKIIKMWDANGIVLKNIKMQNYFPAITRDATPGGEAGDASDFGYHAFTIETLNQNCINGHKFAPIDDTCTTGAKNSRDPSFEVMEKELYPIFKQFYIAVSESVAVTKKGK